MLESSTGLEHWVPAYARAVAIVGLVGAGFLLLERRRRWFSAAFAEVGHPLDLAVVRLVVFVTLAFAQSRDVLVSVSAAPDALYLPPVAWGWLGSPPRDPGVAVVLHAVFVAVCLLAAAGFRTRVTGLAAVILGVYVLGLPNFFGGVCHNHHLLWFGLLLALSPCADVLSVDAWLARRGGGAARGPAPEYGFARASLLTMLGIVYFFPGLWKLAGGWEAWISGEHLADVLQTKWTQLGWQPAWRVDEHPLLLSLGACGTVLFEMSMLPLLLHRRTRWLALIGGLAFHNTTFLVMRIPFWELQLMYVVLIDWGALAGYSRVAAANAASAAVGTGLRGSFRVLAITASVLGILRISDTWPVACYPTFDGPRPESQTVMFAEITGADGAARVLRAETDCRLIEHLGSWRWATALGALERDPSLSEADRTEAFWELWSACFPEQSDPKHVQLFVVHEQNNLDGTSVELSRLSVDARR